MYDFTPVTNGVISSSRLSYIEDFTLVTNGVNSSSRLCLSYGPMSRSGADGI